MGRDSFLGVAQTMKALFVVGTLCLLLSATHAKDVCGFDKATLTAEELFRGVMSYQWKLATSNASSVSYAYVSATLDPYLVGTQTLDTKKGTIMSETHIFGFINQLPTNPYLFQPPPICQATP